jgi:hypothetical protein
MLWVELRACGSERHFRYMSVYLSG